MATSQDPDLSDFLDYQDLTLPLDARLIFEAPPHHFQAIVYVKRQHELLDTAIRNWVQRARECQSGINQEMPPSATNLFIHSFIL